MKKTIFVTALFLMSFLSSDAQQNGDDSEEQLFGSILISKTPSNQKGNAPWQGMRNGVQTNIGKSAQSDYLEVEIPKMKSIKESSSTIQRVIFNIAHQIKLSPTVKAEIEVKLKGNKTWTAFEPITKDFLDITTNGGTPSDNLLKYANGKIFTKNEVQGGHNYDKLYNLHVAGTDAKLNLADVQNIEKFRFRLVKIGTANDIEAEGNALWRIETLAAINSKYTKKGGTGLKGSSEITPKHKLLANTENKPGPIERHIALFIKAGECPEPHPH